MNTNQVFLNSKSFLYMLQTVGKVLSKRPITPIIESYLIEVKAGKVTVTGTDLQNTLRMSFAWAGGQNQADFKAILAPTVIKYLQKLDEQPVLLTYDPATYAIEICEDNGRAKYAGENHFDFPSTPQSDFALFDTTSDLFKEFNDLLKYVSGDQLRPAMTGICFTTHKERVHAVATDGHRIKLVDVTENIFLYSNDQKQDKQHFILSDKAAGILASFKFDKKELPQGVRISFRNKTENLMNEYICFAFQYDAFDIEFITRNIDERFPDYWNVIPEESQALTRYAGDKKTFLKVLDKAELFANKTTHQVRLSLNGANQISAKDNDFNNEYNGNVGGTYEGAPVEIGFNAKFFRDVINSFGDTFTLELREPNRAGVIRDGKSIAVCMPVMLHQYTK